MRHGMEAPEGGDAGRCVRKRMRGRLRSRQPGAGGGLPQGLPGDWRKGIDSTAPIAHHPSAAELLRCSKPAIGQKQVLAIRIFLGFQGEGRAWTW
jgi:hypothetical protein